MTESSRQTENSLKSFWKTYYDYFTFLSLKSLNSISRINLKRNQLLRIFLKNKFELWTVNLSKPIDWELIFSYYMLYVKRARLKYKVSLQNSIFEFLIRHQMQSRDKIFPSRHQICLLINTEWKPVAEIDSGCCCDLDQLNATLACFKCLKPLLKIIKTINV